MTELLERYAIGETLTTNADTFEDTIASKLVENKRRVDLSRLLLVVGNNAANEVRICVPQRRHELGQLFLVELTDGSEHSLLGSLAECRVVTALSDCHTNDLS